MFEYKILSYIIPKSEVGGKKNQGSVYRYLDYARHDRFLIIDDAVYLIGASIKDLGKKWFGFTLMENTSAEELVGRM